MKLIIIGGSRGIGKQIVQSALDQGHIVTVLARNPEAIGMTHSNLRLHAGNALDFSSVERALTGQDAVICALGLPTLKAIGPPLTKRSYVLSSGTENILKAMGSAQMKRFICVTAIATGDSVTQCKPLTRWGLRFGLRRLYKEKDLQEVLIRGSNTNWTIIRPTALTNGPKRSADTSGRYKIGLLTHVSRADTAAVIIDILDKPATYKRAITVTYPPRFGDSLRWAVGYFGKS